MAFRIDLKQLRRQGDQSIELAEDPEELDLIDDSWTFEGPITGLVSFHLVGRDVQARGTLQARAVSSCSRCLAPVAVNAEADFNYIYEPDEEAPRGDVAHEGFDSAAPEVAYYRADRIEPLEEMRESILLALPDHPHCAECEAHPEALVHRIVPPAAAGDESEPEWKRKLRDLGSG